MRAFLAVELDAATRAAIAECIARFRPEFPNISWTRPENVHLTLRFFGEVDAEFIRDYVDRLRPVASGTPPVGARVAGIGAFPNARRASIVWAGITFENDGIATLHAVAESAARELGLEPETRAFVPHVTIGRVRRGTRHVDLTSALERERGFSADAFTVDGVSLFSSELSPQGARYTRLHRLDFDGIRDQSGV